MSKIFFFDIDGTLARHGYVPPGNRYCLEKLKELGYPTFICSGRPPFYVEERFGDLVDGYVCCNGRYTVYRGQVIHALPYTQEEYERCLVTLKKANCHANLLSRDCAISCGLTDVQFLGAAREYGSKRMRGKYKGEPIYTFDLYYPDATRRHQAFSHFEEWAILNDHHNSFTADVSTRSFNKGHGVAQVLEYFGIGEGDSYAFGDGSNDLPMFRVVSHSIAMGNAVEELKEAATYVTDDMDADGILHALHHYGILGIPSKPA